MRLFVFVDCLIDWWIVLCYCFVFLWLRWSWLLACFVCLLCLFCLLFDCLLFDCLVVFLI
jgi:hypothetical protein